MSYEQTIRTLAHKHLVGKKIAAVNYMDKESADGLLWSKRAVIITLEDGTQLIPMADDEGNDAGALATSLDGKLATIGVVS